MDEIPTECKECKNANGCPWAISREATEEEAHPRPNVTVFKVLIPGPSCPIVEIANIKALLQNPFAVLINILRGTIAKPSGFERIDPQVLIAAKEDRYSDEYVGNLLRCNLPPVEQKPGTCSCESPIPRAAYRWNLTIRYHECRQCGNPIKARNG